MNSFDFKEVSNFLPGSVVKTPHVVFQTVWSVPGNGYSPSQPFCVSSRNAVGRSVA